MEFGNVSAAPVRKFWAVEGTGKCRGRLGKKTLSWVGGVGCRFRPLQQEKSLGWGATNFFSVCAPRICGELRFIKFRMR
jgi:hypothetical protein